MDALLLADRGVIRVGIRTWSRSHNDLSQADSSLEAARRFAGAADGWLSVEEGQFLYSLARSCTGRGSIVEIGSWMGRSTIWLAAGSRADEGRPVYAVDPHTGSPEHARDGMPSTLKAFHANIAAAGLTDIVVSRTVTAQEAAIGFNEPVELIFLDGPHDVSTVSAILQAWLPKLIEGDWIVLNNATSYPGSIAASRQLLRSNYIRNARLVRAVFAAQAVPCLTRKDRLHNFYMLLYIYSYRKLAALPVPATLRDSGRNLVRRLQ